MEAAKRPFEASTAAGTLDPQPSTTTRPSKRTTMTWWVVAVATAVVEVVVEAALPGVQAAAAAVTQEQPAVVCRPMPVASATTRGDNVGGAGRGGGVGISGGGRWPGGARGPPLISHQAWPAGVPARLQWWCRQRAKEVYHAVSTSRGPGRRQGWRRRYTFDHKRKQ